MVAQVSQREEGVELGGGDEAHPDTVVDGLGNVGRLVKELQDHAVAVLPLLDPKRDQGDAVAALAEPQGVAFSNHVAAVGVEDLPPNLPEVAQPQIVVAVGNGVHRPQDGARPGLRFAAIPGCQDQEIGDRLGPEHRLGNSGGSVLEEVTLDEGDRLGVDRLGPNLAPWILPVEAVSAQKPERLRSILNRELREIDGGEAVERDPKDGPGIGLLPDGGGHGSAGGRGGSVQWTDHETRFESNPSRRAAWSARRFSVSSFVVSRILQVVPDGARGRPARLRDDSSRARGSGGVDARGDGQRSRCAGAAGRTGPGPAARDPTDRLPFGAPPFRPGPLARVRAAGVPTCGRTDPPHGSPGRDLVDPRRSVCGSARRGGGASAPRGSGPCVDDGGAARYLDALPSGWDRFSSGLPRSSSTCSRPEGRSRGGAWCFRR